MSFKKAFGFAFLALFLLAADVGLKAYIHRHIPTVSASAPIYPYGGIAVFRNWHGIDFSIVHVINRGAAWGFFSSLQQYLLYARMAIIGGLLSWLFFVQASSYRKFHVMLITVGALGNVIDYFLYGHVVDMFYFIFWGYSYPVFNFADSLIFLGIVFLCAESLFLKARVRSASKAEG